MMNLTHVSFAFLLFFLFYDSTEAQQKPESMYDDPVINFGLRQKGKTYNGHIFIHNRCSNTHTVTISLKYGNWLKIAGNNSRTLAPDEEGTFPVQIDLKDQRAGKLLETITLSCESCSDTCAAKSTEIKTAHVVIPVEATFGADPADKNFHGLVNNLPQDSKQWLKSVVEEIKNSGFGKTSREKKIIDELESSYLGSDITLVPTVDKIHKNGKYTQETPEVDDETTRPGDAAYIRDPGPFGIMLEEIYIGIDQSLKGITEARQSPQDYYVFKYNNKMSVAHRASIVHSIIHEGLHAVQNGEFNLDGRAPIEEELDAFEAGNSAAKALNLKPSTTHVKGPLWRKEQPKI